MGTNAETQTYSRLTSETAAEPVPEGLAQALYAAVSVLQYDGVLELTEQECSGLGAPGLLLNLSGGRAEWATMAVEVPHGVAATSAAGVAQGTFYSYFDSKEAVFAEVAQQVVEQPPDRP